MSGSWSQLDHVQVIFISKTGIIGAILSTCIQFTNSNAIFPNHQIKIRLSHMKNAPNHREVQDKDHFQICGKSSKVISTTTMRGTNALEHLI